MRVLPAVLLLFCTERDVVLRVLHQLTMPEGRVRREKIYKLRQSERTGGKKHGLIVVRGRERSVSAP